MHDNTCVNLVPDREDALNNQRVTKLSCLGWELCSHPQRPVPLDLQSEALQKGSDACAARGHQRAPDAPASARCGATWGLEPPSPSGARRGGAGCPGARVSAPAPASRVPAIPGPGAF